MDKEAFLGGLLKTLKEKGRAVASLPGKGVKRLDEAVLKGQRESAKSKTKTGFSHLLGRPLQRAIDRSSLPGKDLLRRARVGARAALHEAKVNPKTLPEDARKMVEETGARVYEKGGHSPIMRKLGPMGVSQYNPFTHKVTIGGSAKDNPNVLKHELGHAGGFARKHPGLDTAAAVATRKVAPALANFLAGKGMKRPAQVVHGIGQAGTIGEEARAWARGIGPDVKKSIKEKGVLKGIFNKEMAKKIPALAGGMGSYIGGAVVQHKALGRMADKAKATLEKKGQGPMPVDPNTAPIMMVPPEYIEQMQAQFGGQEMQQPSMLAQMAMPAALVGGGLGVGAAATQLPKMKAGMSAMKDKLMNLFKGGNEAHFLFGFADELSKIAGGLYTPGAKGAFGKPDFVKRVQARKAGQTSMVTQKEVPIHHPEHLDPAERAKYQKGELKFHATAPIGSGMTTAAAFTEGFLGDIMSKIAKKKMPHFTEQDRPEGVKKVYRALKKGGKPEEMRKRYGKNWKEVAARIATRQGKAGKQHQGPPYKGPLGG